MEGWNKLLVHIKEGKSSLHCFFFILSQVQQLQLLQLTKVSSSPLSAEIFSHKINFGRLQGNTNANTFVSINNSFLLTRSRAQLLIHFQGFDPKFHCILHALTQAHCIDRENADIINCNSLGYQTDFKCWLANKENFQKKDFEITLSIQPGNWVFGYFCLRLP